MINSPFIPLKNIPLVALLLCLVPKSNFLLLLLLMTSEFCQVEAEMLTGLLSFTFTKKTQTTP